MKEYLSIAMILMVLFILFGVMNIVLWYVFGFSIYGLVFGVFFLILAWFVFHFRKKGRSIKGKKG